MRELKILAALLAVFAIGVVASGCGDDDEPSDTTTPAATTSDNDATDDAATDDSDEGDESADPEDSGGEASAEEIYDACIDLIEGTPAEDAGQTSCEQARTAFETCADQAGAVGNDNARERAIRACQQAADQTLATLEASSGG